MARTKNPRMRRKAQIRAKLHRRIGREHDGTVLPGGVPKSERSEAVEPSPAPEVPPTAPEVQPATPERPAAPIQA